MKTTANAGAPWTLQTHGTNACAWRDGMALILTESGLLFRAGAKAVPATWAEWNLLPTATLVAEGDAARREWARELAS